MNTIAVICDGCKRVVLAANPNRLDRKDNNLIGRLAASGHNVQHLPIEAVKEMGWGCVCKKEKRK